MKGRFVSNTGPIIALAAIGKIDIVNEIFDEVIVPEQVHHEIRQGAKIFRGLLFIGRLHG